MLFSMPPYREHSQPALSASLCGWSGPGCSSIPMPKSRSFKTSQKAQPKFISSLDSRVTWGDSPSALYYVVTSWSRCSSTKCQRTYTGNEPINVDDGELQTDGLVNRHLSVVALGNSPACWWPTPSPQCELGCNRTSTSNRGLAQNTTTQSK